jgi:hypothetical protein
LGKSVSKQKKAMKLKTTALIANAASASTLITLPQLRQQTHIMDNRHQGELTTTKTRDDVPLYRLVAVWACPARQKIYPRRDGIADQRTAVMQRSTKKRGRDSDDAGSAPGWVGCETMQATAWLTACWKLTKTPIGKTPRSCQPPISVWDTIHRCLRITLEYEQRGATRPGLQFNTGEGRCLAMRELACAPSA